MNRIISIVWGPLFFSLIGYWVMRLSGNYRFLVGVALVFSLIIGGAGFMISRLPFDIPIPISETILPLLLTTISIFLFTFIGGYLGNYFRRKSK